MGRRRVFTLGCDTHCPSVPTCLALLTEKNLQLSSTLCVFVKIQVTLEGIPDQYGVPRLRCFSAALRVPALLWCTKQPWELSSAAITDPFMNEETEAEIVGSLCWM